MARPGFSSAAFLSTMAMLVGCGSADEPAHFDDAGGSGGSSSGEANAVGAGGDDAGNKSACQEIMGEGYAAGDIAANWSLPNALGEMIELHDMCGKVIFYEEGSMW
ncbi:MAG: hypothetical protein VB934_19730 [Polyangiaceae bacterium]